MTYYGPKTMGSLLDSNMGPSIYYNSHSASRVEAAKFWVRLSSEGQPCSPCSKFSLRIALITQRLPRSCACVYVTVLACGRILHVRFHVSTPSGSDVLGCPVRTCGGVTIRFGRVSGPLSGSDVFRGHRLVVRTCLRVAVRFGCSASGKSRVGSIPSPKSLILGFWSFETSNNRVVEPEDFILEVLWMFRVCVANPRIPSPKKTHTLSVVLRCMHALCWALDLGSSFCGTEDEHRLHVMLFTST